MKDLITKLLLQGKISEAKEIKIDDDTYSELFHWAWDTNNISYYTLIASKLIANEEFENHSDASTMSLTALWANQNIYSVGLYHARRMMHLEPDNIEAKRNLLYFYDIPDQLITHKEALVLAFEVLDIDPTFNIALRVIERNSKSNRSH